MQQRVAISRHPSLTVTLLAHWRGRWDHEPPERAGVLRGCGKGAQGCNCWCHLHTAAAWQDKKLLQDCHSSNCTIAEGHRMATSAQAQQAISCSAAIPVRPITCPPSPHAGRLSASSGRGPADDRPFAALRLTRRCARLAYCKVAIVYSGPLLCAAAASLIQGSKASRCPA